MDKVVEMSPSKGHGGRQSYQASSTLSGTRLNSKIEDLGRFITVITKQQMLDTAVIDINDILPQRGQHRGHGNYTSLTVDRNGGVTDTSRQPADGATASGLDTANTARTTSPSSA